MNKLDTSCGLTKKEIDIIKYNIKRDLNIRLPLPPENVDMKLFFEGRDAWTYSWGVREQAKGAQLARLYVEVTAKLKKEFHYLELPRSQRFLCKVQIGPNIFHPKISIQREEVK